MKKYRFKGLLQAEGWLENATVSIDSQGIITAITQDSDPEAEYVHGYALPGFQNAHSHSFQYGMAGLAEVHAPGSISDDFWSWREAMYALALQVDPDQFESIATMLYAEMVRHGYTNVAEFHYLHRDPNGQPYNRLAEMGERLIAAASRTGLHITLIPIFYQKGGFGKAPNPGQRRFISPDADRYLALLEDSKQACKSYHGANVGIGMHSMRGVEPELIAHLAKHGPQDLPFHIHVSEQLKEIEDSLAYLGKRPVEWLLDNVDLNARYHLVHATHLTNSETERLAKSKANVVLCPSTEGNLGDGIFPLRAFQDFGGQWSIGTDSHIGLNPFEELRLLDYGQRLLTHQRNTFAGAHGDSGRFAIDMALKAGRKAMHNFTESYFAVGEALNACVMDADMPLCQETSTRFLNASLLYASDARSHWGTIIDGKIRSRGSQHLEHEAIREEFARAIKKLGNRL